MRILVLYGKPGCHLCEGLQEKLEQVTTVTFMLELRNIEDNPAWYQQYQYEVPVLKRIDPETSEEILIPRPSPRLSVSQLERHLQQYLS